MGNIEITRTSALILVCLCSKHISPGEKDGVEYHFLSRTLFEEQVASGAFLEWANVHGNLYGTRRSDVEAALECGDDVLLEIDWQGAAQVAEEIPGACRIFILPPSIETLRVRLTSRGQDDALTIERRVAAAESEMAHADEADYRIVNDDFHQALDELHSLYLNNQGNHEITEPKAAAVKAAPCLASMSAACSGAL